MFFMPIMYMYFVVGFMYIMTFLIGQVSMMVLVYSSVTGHSLDFRKKALLWVIFAVFVYYMVWALLTVLFMTYISFLSSEFWSNLYFMSVACGFLMFFFFDPMNYNPSAEEELYVYAKSLPEVSHFFNKFSSKEKVKDLEASLAVLQKEMDEIKAEKGIAVKSAVESLAEDEEGFDDAPKTDADFYKLIGGFVVFLVIFFFVMWVTGI